MNQQITHHIIRLPEVSRKTGLSKSHIWRLIAQDKFPKPIPLGPNARGFSMAEIDQWIEARIAERDAGAQPKQSERAP